MIWVIEYIQLWWDLLKGMTMGYLGVLAFIGAFVLPWVALIMKLAGVKP